MSRIALALVATLMATPSFAQLTPPADWAAHTANEYQVAANVTYLTANNHESKLDVYFRRGATTPQPTVVYFHGVVNVEYRQARVAPATAAVEDCLCALRYLAAQAKTYNIDREFLKKQELGDNP
jgi:acetyl esterase/lipase